MKKLAIGMLVTVVVVVAGRLIATAGEAPEAPRITAKDARKDGRNNVIYEVEYNGGKYIIVETFRGVGICKK